MYITTYNQQQNVQCFITGSEFDPCGSDLVARFYAGSKIKEAGLVTSWRGKKNKREAHAFRRVQYKCSGTSMLKVCNKVGFMDGGTEWMYLLDRHPYCQPMLDFDHVRLTSDHGALEQRKYVVAELYEKANAARFNSAVFVAELGETIKYVKDLLKSVISITKAYKSIAERVVNTHSTWLEYRYAVMPLILTVKDALEALDPKRPKEKVQNYDNYESTKMLDHVFSYSYGTIAFASRTTEKHRAGAAIEILFQNDMAPWGTSLGDAIAAGWERVPLSFVFDWFLDVGLWLGSFRDTNLILGNKYATYVQEITTEVWLNKIGSNMREYYAYPTENQPFVVSGYIIDRVIGDDVLPPSLPCFTPGKLSLLRQLDGLALTLGALMSLRRR